MNVVSFFFGRFSWSFTVLLLASFAALAQPGTVDSLNRLAQQLGRDTSRVNVLIQLSREMYRSGNHDHEVRYATEALELSQSLGFVKGEGDAWTTLGHVAMRKGAYDSALQCLGHAKAAFTAIKNYKSLANVHLCTGQVHDYLAKYNIALEHYRTALALIEAHANDAIKFKILNSSGVTYFNKGSYETALAYYLKALKVSEAFEDRLYYASVLNNIGVVHMSISRYDEALKYFLKYMETMRSLGQPRFVAVAMLNVGEAFMKKQDYQQATHYLDRALAMYRQADEKRGMSLTHSNLGHCYNALNNFQNAGAHYKASIALASTINSDEALLQGLIGAAELYIKSRELSKASKHLDRACNIAKRTGSMLWLEKAYLFNAKLDSARGNYAGAYRWFKNYSALNDSLFNERKSKQVLQMRELYESEKKDKEILLLSEAKKMEEVKASSNQQLLMVSIALFVIVIAAILYWLYVKSRHSTVLKEQNIKITDAYKELKKLIDKVEDQNKILANKNEALEELHREKDGLIGIVAHDLRAPLNRITGLAKLLAFNRQLTKDDKEIIEIIERVCSDGNGLIKDLLEINQVENTQSMEISNVDLALHIGTTLSHYATAVNDKELQLVFEHQGGATISTNVKYLDRILDNIITNAIKFSPPGRQIYIRILSHDTTVRLVVEDQGQGFHPDDMPHLFRKFKKLSARPTGGENSTGLGLSIVKTLAEKLGGSVSITSEWGKGATITVTLPLELEPQPEESLAV
jgi:signal transduction histidine kinase